jgi:hypothetical protein
MYSGALVPGLLLSGPLHPVHRRDLQTGQRVPALPLGRAFLSHGRKFGPPFLADAGVDLHRRRLAGHLHNQLLTVWLERSVPCQ